jgi:hypothetical protein
MRDSESTGSRGTHARRRRVSRRRDAPPHGPVPCPPRAHWPAAARDSPGSARAVRRARPRTEMPRSSNQYAPSSITRTTPRFSKCVVTSGRTPVRRGHEDQDPRAPPLLDHPRPRGQRPPLRLAAEILAAEEQQDRIAAEARHEEDRGQRAEDDEEGLAEPGQEEGAHGPSLRDRRNSAQRYGNAQSRAAQTEGTAHPASHPL